MNKFWRKVIKAFGYEPVKTKDIPVEIKVGVEEGRGYIAPQNSPVIYLNREQTLQLIEALTKYLPGIKK